MSKRWPELKKRLPSSKHQGDRILRFNLKPFSLLTSYGESKVKKEEIPERESLVPTGKENLGS